MTRPTSQLPAAFVTELSNPTGGRFLLLELTFSGGTQRLTDAPRDLLWNALTWQAVGGALVVEGLTETTDLPATGPRLKLGQVDTTILQKLLTQDWRGRPGTCWYGAADLASGQIVGTPLKMFSGLMNGGWQYEESHPDDPSRQTRDATLATQLLSRINDFKRVRGIRMNPKSHQASGYAGAATDTFMQNVAAIAGKRVTWGKSTVDTGATSGGYGGGRGQRPVQAR